MRRQQKAPCFGNQVWGKILWERKHAVPCPKRQMGTVYCRDVNLCDGGGVSSQVSMGDNWYSAEIPVE